MKRGFSPRTMGYVENAYNRLRDRYIDAFAPQLNLTADDVLKLIVPEKHHQLSRDAHRILGASGQWSYNFTLNDPEHPDKLAEITLRYAPIEGQQARAFPFVWDKPVPKLRTDSEFVRPMNDWLAKSLSVRRVWSVGWDALVELNWRCANPKQMRYYAPCIIALLDYADEKAKADEIRNYAVPRDFIFIEPPLKAALAEVQSNIVKASMLPEKVNRPHEKIKPSLGNYYYRPPVPWQGWKPLTEEA